MPSLVIVPSPLQASRAARRLCDAQGGLLFGPQVTTLGALTGAVLAAAGEPRPVLPPLAWRLLAVTAGRAAGGLFAALDTGSGLAGALAAALGELRRGEVTAAVAGQVASELSGAPASRLQALAAALGALEARLEEAGLLDGPAATRAAAEAVRRGAPVAEARQLDLLVLDGHAAFSTAEWDLVAALAARARRARFHVPYFPERPDLSAAAEPYLRRVEGLHGLAARRDIEVALTPIEDPSRAARLTGLLSVFAGGRPVRVAGAGEILVLRGEGEEGEAQLAARTARRLLEGGLAPDDLAVLHPSPRSAAERLAAAFAAEGVPFASGRGPPLGEAPPVRVVLAALGAAAGGLDRSAAERLAGSSYLAASGPAARLGRLLDRSGALEGRLAPEAALRLRAERLDAPAARRERKALRLAADGLAALADVVRPLGGELVPGAHVARLAAFLDASGLRRRAARGDPQVAARDLAALSCLEQAADDLARALVLAGRGSERIGPGEWRALLGLAVEGATLPATGQPVAEAVELWGLDEAPGRATRAALVLGCRRGDFPALPPPEPLLREPERRAVNERLRRAALATSTMRRAEALHQAACALVAGREVLAIGFPGDGPAAAPAPLVAEALRAAGVAIPPEAPRPGLEVARTEGEALAAVARLGREEGAGFAARALAALSPALSARGASALARGAIEAERRAAVLAGSTSLHAGRVEGPALEALRARLPAEWTASLLETHARCPFRLLLAVGVGLRDGEATGLDIDPRDEGSLLHAILERWVAGRVARRAWPPEDAPADRREARAEAMALFDRFEREGRTGDPAVWTARREAVLARLDRIVAAEAREGGGLTPTLLEFRFGEGSGRPPLALTAGGETVLVKGRIDRVDASPEQLLVIDYKSGRNARKYARLLEQEAAGVESFQVPLYLLAAARELPGRAPAATYRFLKGGRLEPVAGAPDQAALAEAVAGSVRRIRGGELPISSRDCEGCPFGAVCRFEGLAARSGGEADP